MMYYLISYNKYNYDGLKGFLAGIEFAPSLSLRFCDTSPAISPSLNVVTVFKQGAPGGGGAVAVLQIELEKA